MDDEEVHYFQPIITKTKKIVYSSPAFFLLILQTCLSILVLAVSKFYFNFALVISSFKQTVKYD